MKRLWLKAGWYLRRLRVMPWPEIPWRLQRALRLRGLALYCRHTRAAAPDLARLPGQPLLLAADAAQALPPSPLADWLQAGFPVFERRWPLDRVPDWRRDPLTGVRAPDTCGFFIDYRDERRVGDIKYLWEPARFHACVPLAQAWRASGEAHYLEAIAQQLDSFLDQCPCPQGVHWSSALESGIRLINWALLWELTGGRDSPLLVGAAGQARLQRWLEAIYWHQCVIHQSYAAWSSANNHLIGEAAGVFVAASVWPLWPHSAAWRHRARDILERECLRQNHPDGVNAEQALCYQQFVADFLLLASLVAQRQGQPFSAAYAQRLQRMLEFLAALADGEGGWPQLGDADEGLACGLAAGVTANYRSLLASGAVLFQRPALARAAAGWDGKSDALLGQAAGAAFACLRAQAGDSLPEAFRSGGHYRLGDHHGLCVWIDAGPLGLGALAAHGHADALQLLLWVDGLPLLVDPGTYAYHTEPRWRNYFRGTLAHNTVRIDGLDQSVIGGNFLWMEKARAGCTAFGRVDGAWHFSGYHDGYCRLPSSVRHQRSLQLDADATCLQVVDGLQASGSHTVEQCWHFDPRWRPELAGTQVQVQAGQARVAMALDPALIWSLVRGDETRPLGWHSDRLGHRRPATVLIGCGRITGDTVLHTRITRLASGD